MKRLVVLGAGESGTGAAILAKDKGYEVLLSDSGSISPRYEQALRAEGIEFEQGGHSIERILAADEIVKSPGIPATAPVIRQAVQAGIPVISEIELAGRYLPATARTVCITGSNGKTTTTMLCCHLLRTAGIDASTAGNIGRSLALQVAREPHDVYVIELSSFQLDNMYDFRADVAVLMNITPDHLDRYDNRMEGYIAAKLRILQNQRPDDAFIHWADDPVVMAELAAGRAATPARDLVFTALDCPGAAAYASADGRLVLPGVLDMPLAELSLPGTHNLLNSMAAALAAHAAGAGADALRSGLATFAPVEHRLEPAGTVDGVEWINDSKATNVNSTFYALGAMTTPTRAHPRRQRQRQRLQRDTAPGPRQSQGHRSHGPAQREDRRLLQPRGPRSVHLLAPRRHRRLPQPRPSRRHRAPLPLLRQLRPLQKLRRPRPPLQASRSSPKTSIRSSPKPHKPYNSYNSYNSYKS